MDNFDENKQDRKKSTKKFETSQILMSKFTSIPKKVEDINLYPRKLKKGEIPLKKEDIDTTFKSFMKENKTFLKVDSKDLKMVSSRNISNKWFVKYEQYYNGIPVYNSSVGLEALDDGEVQSFESNYRPNISVSTDPKITIDEAVEVAKNTYKKEDADKLQLNENQLIIYPEKKEDSIDYRLAWRFLLADENIDPYLDKYFIVDAIDKRILSYSFLRRQTYYSGTVKGEIYPRFSTDEVKVVPLKYSNVDIKPSYTSGAEGVTDANGNFSIYHPNWWLIFPKGFITISLSGPHASVVNHDRSEYKHTWEIEKNKSLLGINHTWSADDRDHINVFYHINKYYDWWKNVFGYKWRGIKGQTCFSARVNLNFDNSFSGFPMIFGSDEIARTAGIIYHECTHNIIESEFNGYIENSYNFKSEAYAMDEGFADYFSCACLNSPYVETCKNEKRNLKNDIQYPGRKNYNLQGHYGGQIIAGAAWRFREQFVGIVPNGGNIADEIIFNALKVLSTSPRKYYFSDPHESNFLSALYKTVDINTQSRVRVRFFYEIQKAFHNHNLLQVVLNNNESFNFGRNKIAQVVSDGELYHDEDIIYFGGKFLTYRSLRGGIIDLGDIGEKELSIVDIPESGYVENGVKAIINHTYVVKAQYYSPSDYVVFRITDMSNDKSNVTLKYLCRFKPHRYMLNDETLEVHKYECIWTSFMYARNSYYFEGIKRFIELVNYDERINGCCFCLPRYDTDFSNRETMMKNLEEDLEE